MYPDTVAGANPKVGPYCSSRWLPEGLWLMQRSEFGDSRGSATAPLHAQPQTEGRPDLGTFRRVWYGSARFDGRGGSGLNQKGDLSQPPAHLACQKKFCLNCRALARRLRGLELRTQVTFTIKILKNRRKFAVFFKIFFGF